MVLLQLKLESSQPDSYLSTNENWMPIGDNLPELPPASAGGEKSVIYGFSQIELPVEIALLDVTEIENHYFSTTIPTVRNSLHLTAAPPPVSSAHPHAYEFSQNTLLPVLLVSEYVLYWRSASPQARAHLRVGR